MAAQEPRPSPDAPVEEHLAWYVADLGTSADPDAAALELGCGDLEELLRDHETELWPELERLARTDPVFRRALRAVWAYDSPMFHQREALLGELGEWRRTWVRFVVEPTLIEDGAPLSWRAIELEGSITPKQLAPLLRSIADWADQQDPPLPG